MVKYARCIAAWLVAGLSACGSTGEDGPAVAGVVAVNAGGDGWPNIVTPDGRTPPAVEGEPCLGQGRAGDAKPGALITFYGASNEIVGTAKLNVGKLSAPGGGVFCVMPFSGKLNKKSTVYQAEFGTSGRKTIEPAGLGDVILNVH